MSTRPAFQLVELTRRYGELTACDSVSLDIGRGEVLALLGENGAGKSTLMKLVYGFVQPDSGTVRRDGEPIALTSPRQAMAQGIGMVFQQFSLIPALNVLENLLLAWPDAKRWRCSAEDAAVIKQLKRLAPDIRPSAMVRDLSVGERQLVELAKVLNLDAQLVILDEPTSVLTPQEAARLHRLVRALADDGRTVVLITHKLADVRACADRVAVMRRGRLVDQGAVGERSDTQLVEAMVGQAVDRNARHREAGSRVPRLVLNGLNCHGASPARDVNLSVGKGEILGIAGVAGNGQWALAETIAGLVAPESGEVLLDGEPVTRRFEQEAFASPIAYIPEDAIRNAVVGSLGLRENLGLRRVASGQAMPSLEDARKRLQAFDVRPPEPDRQAETLSGGNLQKLVAARELDETPAAIVACYPTMGLDVQATDSLISRLVDHAAAGAAVLWISEEIEDLLAYADRIAVMREGRIVAECLPSETSITEIGRFMTSGDRTAA